MTTKTIVWPFAYDSSVAVALFPFPSGSERITDGYLATVLCTFPRILASLGLQITCQPLSEMVGNTKKEVEYHGKEKSRQSQGNCR